jgi:hypothetical protein
MFGGMPQPTGTVDLDDEAAADLLRHAGVSRSATLRLHITALRRAAAQALAQ